jgi:hypothetical protein
VCIDASYLHEKGQPMSWQATYVRYIRHEQMHLERFI